METPLISLRLYHMHSAGYAWGAAISFTSKTGGFDVVYQADESLDHTSLQDPGGLTWRSACRFMLDNEEVTVSGHFGKQIEVSGEEGLKADILRLCWQSYDDEVPHGVKHFLVDLDDLSLSWLEGKLSSGLLEGISVDLLGRYLETFDGTPMREAWSSIEANDAQLNSFEDFVSRLEELAGEASEAEEITREQKLAKFREEIARIVDSAFSGNQTRNMWTEISTSSKRNNLRSRIESYVLANTRLPESEAVQLMINAIKHGRNMGP